MYLDTRSHEITVIKFNYFLFNLWEYKRTHIHVCKQMIGSYIDGVTAFVTKEPNQYSVPYEV